MCCAYESEGSGVNTKIHNLIILGLSFLLLIGEWGCAHHAFAPFPLLESMRQQLGKIGVLARSTEEHKTLDAPSTAWLINMGREAVVGVGMGPYLGLVEGEKP